MSSIDRQVIHMANEFEKSAHRLVSVARQLGWDGQETAGFQRGIEAAQRLIQDVKSRHQRK